MTNRFLTIPKIACTCFTNVQAILFIEFGFRNKYLSLWAVFTIFPLPNAQHQTEAKSIASKTKSSKSSDFTSLRISAKIS